MLMSIGLLLARLSSTVLQAPVLLAGPFMVQKGVTVPSVIRWMSDECILVAQTKAINGNAVISSLLVVIGVPFGSL